MRRVASLDNKCEAASGLLRSLSIGVLLFVAGCFPNRPEHPAAYFGPTESLSQVANQINANNQQIPTLWARVAYFEADVREKRGDKSQFVNGSGGYLMMRHPGEMRLRANKAGIGTVLDAGANSDDVWLVAPPADRAWWAQRKNIGKPCMQEMPIDPLAVMDVLGVGMFDTDFLHEPAPMMRFNNDRDAYMVIWQSKATDSPNRWIARREVWYDRRTKLPELVNLFDENGRVVVSAYLSEHQNVEGTTAKLARKFQLLFPDTDSHFTFSLSDVKLTNGTFPNDRSFLFNPSHTGVTDVHQMDGNCK
jgi:hypothetical protein